MNEKREDIFIPAIDEIGNCAIAHFLMEAGYGVGGRAGRVTPAVESLQDAGARVHAGSDEIANLAGYPRLMASPGLSEDDPDLTAARAAGLEIIEKNELLGEVSRAYRTIGVTGTHGKGTVAGMIAWILEKAGMEPGFIIGGEVRNFGTNARLGGGEWLVLEVDESDGSHRLLDCDYGICNFLEVDHLEHYQGMEDILGKMKVFFESNPRLKEAFINLDCVGNRRLVADLEMRPTGYATGHRAEFRCELREGGCGSSFEVFHRDLSLGEFQLGLPGDHNRVNALGAIAVASRLGVEPEVISDALKSFEGLKNRYATTRGGGVTIVKDFTGHPTGIGAVLASERALAKDAELLAVFQPWERSLVRFLGPEYVKAFEEADQVIVGSPKAGYGDEGKRDVETLVGQLQREDRPVIYLPTENDIGAYLLKVLSPGDRVVFFGNEEFLERADHILADLALEAGRAEPEEEQPRLDGPLAQRGADES